METLQDRLRKIRGGKTQAAFSSENGVPITTLGRYERGDNLPDLEFIMALCVRYAIAPAWLLFGAGPMHTDALAQVADGVPGAGHGASPSKMVEAAAGKCLRCGKLESELELERGERRELSAENRQLWRENAALRERLARLEEREDKPGVGACTAREGQVA